LTTCLLHTSPTTHLHAFPTRRSSDLDQNLELSATHLGADRVAADVVARPTDKMLDVAERAADLLLQAGGLERAVLIELRGGHRDGGVGRHPDERPVRKLDRGVSPMSGAHR